MKRKYFNGEPHISTCPKCSVRMIWSEWQGTNGGWKCLCCGLQIDE